MKNWISSSDTRLASKIWGVFQQDFDWLMDEIDAGNKNKVAFVIGWFNCVDSFSQLIQLGKGGGAYPLVDERKLWRGLWEIFNEILYFLFTVST